MANTVAVRIPNGKSDTAYTGERFALERPKQYRIVANLIAEGWSQRKIHRLYGHHHRLIAAVALREAESIDARKKQIVAKMFNIADCGAVRVEETIGKASCRDAVIGTGVAIDKALALLGQTPTVQIANVVLPNDQERAERRALHDKLDEIAQRLKARSSDNA